MNVAIFVGNLTRDPETQVLQSGDTQTRFTIAVNRPYKNNEGGQDADFIQVKCYKKNAENAAKYLKKGRKVGVTCKVKTGSYEKENGQKIYTTDFVVENLEFLSSAQGEESEAAAAAAPEPAQQTSNVPQGYTAVNEDGLPF